jgi:hypothetical protein
MKTDPSLLAAALIGYHDQLNRIKAAIADIERQLGKTKSKKSGTEEAPAKKGRRRLSAAARKRIAAAQRKRWAEYKKQQAAKQ